MESVANSSVSAKLPAYPALDRRNSKSEQKIVNSSHNYLEIKECVLIRLPTWFRPLVYRTVLSIRRSLRTLLGPYLSWPDCRWVIILPAWTISHLHREFELHVVCSICADNEVTDMGNDLPFFLVPPIFSINARVGFKSHALNKSPNWQASKEPVPSAS